MLTYDPNASIRSFAVDPGTSTLGFSIVDVDANSKLHLIHSDTIEIEKEIRRSSEYSAIAEDFGMKQARLEVIRDILLELLLEYEPHVLSLETPYMGRFPAAFRALVECMMTILHTYRLYDVNCPIHAVDPKSAKVSVGVTERGSNKDLVEQKLRAKFAGGEFLPNPLIEHMDEHAWDSLAVNYHTLEFYDFFKGQLNEKSTK